MRKTIEETLNAPLDEESSELVGAERYERATNRETYHSCHYARRLITGVGEIEPSVQKLRGTAARTVCDGFAETLAYTEFPPEHWRRIRTNNGIERINREIRRRTRVVGKFQDGNSALMLVTARLKYIAQSFPSAASLVRLAGAVMCEQDEILQESRYFSEAKMRELYDEARMRGIDWARLEAEARKMIESGLKLADRIEAA